jgi:hypothetical protein
MGQYQLCPGCVNLCRTLPPESRDSQPEWTTDGEAIHAALAGERSPEELTPEQLAKHDRLDYMLEVVKARFGMGIWMKERRIWSENEDYSGRFDVTAVSADKGLVLDYKTGWQKVTDAARNLQVRTGVVLLKKAFPKLRQISGVILQIGRPISMTTYDEEDIAAAREQIESIVESTKAQDAPRRAGTVQCQFCPAAKAGACPEHQAMVTETLDVGSLGEITSDKWTPQQWAQFCNTVSAARKWIDSRVAEAKSRLADDPESVPGWFLKPGKVVESIDAKALAHLVDQGYDFDALSAAAKLSKTKLRPVLGQLSKTKGKVLDALYWRLLGKFITTKRSAPELAPKDE